MTDQAQPMNGRVLGGKYRLEHLLGEGAFGAVFRARHLSLGKDVAVKILHRTLSEQADAARRFKAEARAASQLEHPHSIQVFDFGEEPDRLLYLVMELVDGRDLQAVLHERGQLPPEQVQDLLFQVARVLAKAHGLGIIHRDLKPGNIMMVSSEDEMGQVREVAKVCDFGLAKMLEGNADESSSGPVTQAGSVFGTPSYMAPEQARGHPTDARADVYAFGVLMFRLYAGRLPFESETPVGMLMKHIMDPPPELMALVPGIDPQVAELVAQLLEKDAGDRPESMVEVLRRLGTIFGRSLGRVPTAIVRTLPGAGSDSLPPPASLVSDPHLVRPASPLVDASVATSSSMATYPQPQRARWVLPVAALGAAALTFGVAAAVLRLQAPRVETEQLAVLQESGAPAPSGRTGAPATPEKAESAPETVASAFAASPGPRADGTGSDLGARPGAAEASEPGGGQASDAPRGEAPSGRRRRRSSKPSSSPRSEVEAEERSEPRGEGGPSGPSRPRASAASGESSGTPAPTGSRPTQPSGTEPGGTEPRGTPPEPDSEPKATSTAEPASPPATAPPPKPAGPAPLAPGWRLRIRLADVESLGGMSKRGIRQGLEREIGDFEACLRPELMQRGTEAEGRIQAEGIIGMTGRLQRIKARSGFGAGCVQKSFRSARMPRPDTGEAALKFVLSYSAKN